MSESVSQRLRVTVCRMEIAIHNFNLRPLVFSELFCLAINLLHSSRSLRFDNKYFVVHTTHQRAYTSLHPPDSHSLALSLFPFPIILRRFREQFLELPILNLPRSVRVNGVDQLLNVDLQSEVMFDDLDEGCALDVTAFVGLATAGYKGVDCRNRERERAGRRNEAG